MKVKVDVTYVQTIVVKIDSGLILQVNEYKLPGKHRKSDLQSRVFDPNKHFGIVEIGCDRNILPEGAKEKIIYCKCDKIELVCREDHLLKDAGVFTGHLSAEITDDAGVFTGHLSAEITDDAYVEVEVKEDEINE